MILYLILRRKIATRIASQQSLNYSSIKTGQAIAAIDSTGNLSSLSFPSGFIAIWYPPDTSLTSLAFASRAICDGTKGTPDLRGRFVLMAQDAIPVANIPPGTSVHPIMSIGGEEKHVLSIAEMPSHNHIFENNFNDNKANSIGHPNGSDGYGDGRTRNEGGSQAHNTMPPYYTLVYVMKL